MERKREGNMKIRRCRINHIKNPLGYWMRSVTASWVAESDVSRKQKEARILVASDGEMQHILLDTGYQDLDSTGTKLDLKLQPCTRYFWQVEVKGDQGDRGISPVQYFETGKMETPFTGKWITTPWENQTIRPVIIKRFTLEEEPAGARVYMTALGIYRLSVNGKPASKEILAPGSDTVEDWVQIQTYDVTALLQEGENELRIYVGDGWAKSQFGTFGEAINRPYTDHYSVLLDLVITKKDGEEITIGSDESFLAAKSHILKDGIYYGEDVDFNEKEDDFSPCRIFDPGAQKKKIGKLCDRLSLQVTERMTFAPKEMITTPAGETVLDLGQNISGYVRFRFHEKKGTRVMLQAGETLQNGNFYRDNLRGARAAFTAVSDGEEHIVSPMFTFFGFRYVKLTGFTNPQLSDFTAVHISSDLERTGFVETSDDRINRLYENSWWSNVDNFVDVPTDCPQRDERMGWTGDAQVFCKTASFHQDTYAFYTKWLHDVYLEQLDRDGMVASVVPSYMPDKNSQSGFVVGGSSVWGDCATIIPWTVYRTYGDPAILKDQFDSMKQWVDWIYRLNCEDGGNGLLWRKGFQFGDWLALDGPKPGGVRGGTEETYIASVYYYNSARLTAEAASVLGLAEEEKKYTDLAEKILAEIRKEYFSPNGRCVLGTQTALVLALHFGIVPEKARKRTAKALYSRVIHDGVQLRTGFVGTPFLCLTLSGNGYHRTACDLLFRDEYPGWLYEVKMGATTIWERWNSILPDGSISGTGMNSLNHYSYGSIAEWMYRVLGGIEQDPEVPGYRRFVLHPMPDGRLRCVKVSYDSACGNIQSSYEIEGSNSVHLHLSVPFGTECTLILDAKPGSVRGVSVNMDDAGRSTAVLRAGEYDIRYTSTEDLSNGYSLEDSLDALLANPETKQVLEETAPILMSLREDQRPLSDIPLRPAFEDILGHQGQDALEEMAKNGTEEKLRKIRKPMQDNGLHI